MIVKEELDGIDIDGNGNLEDLLRIVFIHEECRNRKVLVDGGETRHFANLCPLCDNKVIGQSIFFNEHVEYCELVR